MTSSLHAVLLSLLAIPGDRPLAGYQAELLDVAFQAASAFPLRPHVKNRSRAQEEVVRACFQLDQPRRALACVEQIEGWRKGAGYAAFAKYCARHGESGEVEHYLRLAREIAERNSSEEDFQDWQSDRILVEIAETRYLLGQEEEARKLEADLVPSESGKVDQVRAARAAGDTFEADLARIRATADAGDFDAVRNALEVGVALFDRHYADADRRARARSAIESSWTKLPSMIRMELLMDLVGAALRHEDAAEALRLLDASDRIRAEATWTPEDAILLESRLAALRFRAGDAARARAGTDRAHETYETMRSQIVDIQRAGALRQLAEAYQAMGETAAALAVYRKAFEEGVVNPNSRPRANDLTATCCSMAVSGVEPDAELRARIRKICGGLGDPW